MQETFNLVCGYFVKKSKADSEGIDVSNFYYLNSGYYLFS
jgi:hypothetical protein